MTEQRRKLIQSLTCKGDIEIRNTLENDPVIKRIAGRVRNDIERPEETARALLGSSLRLTESISPDIFAIGQQVVKFLETEDESEFFIFPEPRFNAACFAPEKGKLFIIVSSGLIESFSNRELVFILGHELGHLAAEHHSFPVGIMVASKKSELGPERILKLFAWQRFAEITADRIGAYLSGSFDIAGKVFFKLASGVGGERLRVNLDDFLSQVDSLEEEIFQADEIIHSGPRKEWYSTHPFSPIRLKALQYFFNSDLFKQAKQEMRESDTDNALEEEITRMMELMSPGYLAGKSEEDEIMRRLLFVAGILLTSFSSEMTGEETRMLQSMLGKISLPITPDLDRLEKMLPELQKTICVKISRSKRTRLIADLLLIAKADGKLSDRERKFLESIVLGLTLDPKSFNI